MRLLFTLIGLLGFSLSATADNEWLYYKEYPWVYDAKSEDWLYLRGAADGSIYAYRNSTKEWEKVTTPEPTWNDEYKKWVHNPEPYGGLYVLQQIKEAKDSGATELDLGSTSIKDLSPLTGLTNLTKLNLGLNNITDLSPLAGLTNLTGLVLVENPITASQKAMLNEALQARIIFDLDYDESILNAIIGEVIIDDDDHIDMNEILRSLQSP